MNTRSIDVGGRASVPGSRQHHERTAIHFRRLLQTCGRILLLSLLLLYLASVLTATARADDQRDITFPGGHTAGDVSART